MNLRISKENLTMANFYEKVNGENGSVVATENTGYNYHIPNSLSWLDLRIFYVRISKCEIDEDDDDSTPEYLTLNHVQLNPDTLTEVNGVRTGVYSDAESILLRRDRVDKKSEEVTFVSTESIRTTGSVKFEVFRTKDKVLVLSGMLELCEEEQQQRWNIICESDFQSVVEVYVAGCYSGRPIILSNAPQQLGHKRRKPINKGMLETIPEYYEDSYGFNMQVAEEPENEECKDHHYYPHMMEDLEGEGEGEGEEEDGELSWFNAGVRVGMGIGLSVCLGIGIGVGLVVKAYHGTSGNFRIRRRRQRRLS